ncbi:MAG: glycerophosphodiester phosphodiesterase [Polyangiaceae bacterium]|nr:glycerophosphodiester phosphodiesterase [Polyangiaceae bacterium]MCL4751359.1 glycerophosphodiester phosphodiesterase [Myxococcales bacterium]
MRSALPALLSLVLFACGEDEGASKAASCDHRFLCEAPLSFAHRGGGKLRPEETLPAYENAAAVGAHVLEADVHTSADGEVVCMHDATVDRTTNGSGAIHEKTLAELKQLDAGYHFSPDGGASFPWRNKGVTIPTLGEVLDAHPDAWWTIELKQLSPSIVDPVIALLDQKGATTRTVLVSFSDDVVQEIREKRPDILTGMGVGEMLALNALSDETEQDYEPPTRIVQPPASAVNAELMARAERLGLRIHVWTVNDRPEMEALLDIGVHGIMTDDPALLGQVLSER